MFRNKNQNDEVGQIARQYSKDMDTVATVIKNFGKRLDKLEMDNPNDILEKIYLHGSISPAKGNMMWDLLQFPPTWIPVGGNISVFDKQYFKGRGFLGNVLVGSSSNLLGLQVTTTLKGHETTGFQGTILDLIVLGRVPPNSRPPSGGLFCSLVGAPLWVVEAEFPSITLRPFDEMLIRLYNTDIVPILVSRCTLAYLYYSDK